MAAQVIAKAHDLPVWSWAELQAQIAIAVEEGLPRFGWFVELRELLVAALPSGEVVEVHQLADDRLVTCSGAGCVLC